MCTSRPRVFLARLADGCDSDLSELLEVDFEVEAHVGPSSQVVEALAAFRAHLVVLDLRGPHGEALPLLRAVRDAQPDVAVAIVAKDLSDDAVLEAIRLDVTGLVMADASPDAVVRCVRQVHEGHVSLDQQVLRRVVKGFAERQLTVRELARTVTAREMEIITLVGRGLTNKEIASELFIVEGTIKVHLHHVFRKLGIGNRQTLATYAREKGLIHDSMRR